MSARTAMVPDVVTPLLTKIGFKKRRGEIFTIELSKEVLGWVGLNRATKHRPAGEIEINPVIGVRHQQVERLVAELRGQKFHAYIPPTISTALGYVLPEASYRAWIFTADRARVMANEMVAAIAEHGLALMRSKVELSDLCRALEQGSRLAIEDWRASLAPPPSAGSPVPDRPKSLLAPRARSPANTLAETAVGLRVTPRKFERVRATEPQLVPLFS